MFGVKRFVVVAVGIGLAASTSHAQDWGDRLKSAADDSAAEAARPATDAADEAKARADAAKGATEAARGSTEQAPSAASALPESSLSEAAKRAGGKGATTATDSIVGGATAGDAAKKGGAAAVDEVLRPSVPSPVAAPEEAPE